ncbi:MAG: CvpA family protein [Alphaproteobacteria bacterium]|nr:CvpA family protein [Alphaproteobacteria bacterium]
MGSINTFDLGVAGLLLASGVFAFRRGFIKEIFSLGTWIGASIIAATYYQALKPWVMSHHIKNELAGSAIAALALFGLSLLVLISTGSLLTGMIKGPTMTSIDRSLGFVFGLLRGLLVLSLIYLCLTFVWPKADEQPVWLAEAKTKPLLADGADMLKSFVPKDEREEAAEELEKNRETATKALEDAERLDEMSTPVPSAGKKGRKDSSYDDKLRNVMDDLTNSKSEKQ